MPVVSEDMRLTELRRLGLSDPVIRLATGELIHEMFRFRCDGPPYKNYHGAEAASGPVLIPLWECGDSVTGVWERAGGLQFLMFDVEAAEEYTLLAHSEQGFWATVFVDLREDYDEVDWIDFREPARLVGFRFLDDVMTAYEQVDHRTFEAHYAFLRELTQRIDRWEVEGFRG